MLVLPSSSPLRKVVFIKRIVLFASRDVKTIALLTKGINSEFEEVMLNFSGFIESLVNLRKCFYSFSYFYSKYSDRYRLIPRLLHDSSSTSCKWILAEILANEQYNKFFGLDIQNHPSKFGVFLKSIFTGRDSDEVIEVLELLKSRGALPQDLSSARIGASQSTLLHTALRHHFDQTYIEEDGDPGFDWKTNQFQDGRRTMREPDDKFEKRTRKMLSYLMVDCGIHPFEFVDANGFNAFHVAVRHHMMPSPIVIKIMIELLPEKDRQDPDRLRELINSRISNVSTCKSLSVTRKIALSKKPVDQNPAGGNLRTALGIVASQICSLKFHLKEQGAQCVQSFKLLQQWGADPSMQMVSQAPPGNSYWRYTRRYDRVFSPRTPLNLIEHVTNSCNADFANCVREFAIKWKEQVEEERKRKQSENLQAVARREAEKVANEYGVDVLKKQEIP